MMGEVVERIEPGLPELTRIFAEFLSAAREEILEKQEHGYFKDYAPEWTDDVSSPSARRNPDRPNGNPQDFNVMGLDFLQLFYLWNNNKGAIQKETDIPDLAQNYLFELRTIRGDGHHSTAEKNFVSDSDYVARALDTMRRLILLLLPYINLHRKVEDELFPPEFKYSINQPQDSMIMVSQPPAMKTKATENVLVRRAPYDFSKARYEFSKNTIPKIFKDFNCLKRGESAMVVRTYGDVFQYTSVGSGYTGDWEKDAEVTKIFIVHFFEGKDSRQAHTYVADYKERIKENNYTPKRYRYYFNNIQYCGLINADPGRDFKSCQVVRFEELG